MLFISLLYIQHNNISLVQAVERKPCISRFISSVRSSKTSGSKLEFPSRNFRRDELKVFAYDRKSIAIRLPVGAIKRRARRGCNTVKITSRKLFRFHIDSFVYTLRYFAVSFCCHYFPDFI